MLVRLRQPSVVLCFALPLHRPSSCSLGPPFACSLSFPFFATTAAVCAILLLLLLLLRANNIHLSTEPALSVGSLLSQHMCVILMRCRCRCRTLSGMEVNRLRLDITRAYAAYTEGRECIDKCEYDKALQNLSFALQCINKVSSQ